MMGYDLRRRGKWPDHLTAEEYEVAQALERAGYRFDARECDSFVPTSTLYGAYQDYISDQSFRMQDEEMPVNLNTRQFGAAIQRVFPFDEIDYACRVRRTYRGRRRWGYIGLIGPEAEQTKSTSGPYPE